MLFTNKLKKFTAISVISLGGIVISWAHCEIPCGIYDDATRFDLLETHYQTIEKSMQKIEELDSAEKINYNQLVRWVMNKEDHANMVQHEVWQYFMTQRISPGQENYEEKIILLHKMLREAMKTKQSTDLSHVEKLRKLTQEFHALYFDEHMEAHMKEHHKHSE